MEFIPGPFQLLERARNAPNRWAKRIAPLLNKVRPKAGSVKGVPWGRALGPLTTAGLTYADIQGGEEPWKAAGRNVSGLVGGSLVAPFAEAIPIPGTSVPGFIAGDQLGRNLFDKAIDDRGLSGLLQGKGWNNPWGPAPSTGMANIPATVPSTGQSHKDFELEQLQQQGGYIPPGMTTSAGVPVEAQAGGQQSLYDSDRAAWLAKTANSPAARSGAFTDEERWQTQLGHQQWKKDNNRSFNYGEFLN